MNQNPYRYRKLKKLEKQLRVNGHNTVDGHSWDITLDTLNLT